MTSRAPLVALGALAAGAAAAGLKSRSIRRGIAASEAAVPGHRAFWEDPRHAEGELLYVALGDSAGQSIGTADPLDGYVGITARRLAEATGRSVAVANLCVSGARSIRLLERQVPRLDELPRTPDVVTCVIGGNDVYRKTDFAEFDETYAALVDALPAGTVIGDVPCFRVPHWERRVRRLNATVHREAARAGLAVAPLHERTRRMSWRTHLDGLAADWFHPNERGYRVWADALWDVLEERAAALR